MLRARIPLTRVITTLLTTLVTALSACLVASAQTTPAKPVPCEQNPTYHKLDFWVGEWDVFDIKSGKADGANRIEKILRSCAIVENWTDADGSEGKSLFYVQRATGQWKQVWVEDSGGMKEKSLQDSYSGEGVRFQGEILHRDGSSHLDRTTLRPMSGGRVRQTIEISRNARKTWEVVYDAEYRRRK
jgi:hypothetical protein